MCSFVQICSFRVQRSFIMGDLSSTVNARGDLPGCLQRWWFLVWRTSILMWKLSSYAEGGLHKNGPVKDGLQRRCNRVLQASLAAQW